MQMLSPIAWMIVVAVISLTIGWFVSEFRCRRGIRLTLGCLALLSAFGVAFVVGSLERFNSNAWFGGASARLIEATVSELEAGNTKNTLRVLRKLRADYHPTYENRGRYDKLVDQAVEEMKSAQVE